METGVVTPGIWPKVRRVLALILLTVAAFIFIFPFFWMISTSLKTLREVTIFPPPLFPEVPQFENYTTAFTRAPLARYGLNSLIVCTSVIVLNIFLATLASYTLVFLDFRGKEFIYLMLMAPQMVAGVTLMLPLFTVLHTLKLLNTYTALIIPYSVLYSPFSVMLLRGYLETIPKELVDAARVDGCTEITTMTRVIFPLLRPPLATIAIFLFIWSWNEFLYAMVYIQKPLLRTISVGIAMLQSVPNFPPQNNIILAAATAVTMPVLILFSFMQGQFIESMTQGAIK